MTINTWINNELITIDTDDVWASTFAHWDALVETDTAAAIATATVKALTKPTKPTKGTPTVDVNAMTDAELFAYRKRTAPVGDIRFIGERCRASEALQHEISVLLSGKGPSRADATRVTCLWRMERAKADGWATDAEFIALDRAKLAGQATDESEAA